MKRIIDLVFSATGLVLLVPVLFIVTCIILLLERESPLFIQARLGRNKRSFQIYKFRTMLDGEITSIGRILRKTGIDELPQLVNVLLGDMSFVGPRPLLESDIVRLGWTGEYYARRWDVRPGITGLAQLGSKCHKKFTWLHDRYYVENASLCLDIKLLCLSFGVPFLGKATVKKLIHK
ncbi:MAG: sugar transferase [Akkermansiaceae bacterium]